ncbi:MAG: DNA polymerase III subunit beta [Desulfohalobiaceae bacterium]
MKLTVVKEQVIDGLQKASSIIPARTGAAFLRTIWLRAQDGSLSILSTDSNLEFSGTYPAQSAQDGLVGVQGRKFYDLFRRLPPGEITLTLDASNNTLLLEQGRKKYKLPTNDPTWFQDFAPFPADNAVLWSGDFLKEMIDRVSFCISDEDTMEAMNCLKVRPKADRETVEVCGLNGHQFAMLRFVNPDIHSIMPEDGILIAKRYLMELRKWLSGNEIHFNIDQKRLFFTNQAQNEIFSLPLSYYEYPKYQNFLSRFDASVSSMDVDRDELVDSLERVSLFNTDNQRCSYFVFDQSELVLYSQGQDTGEATELLSIAFTGELNKIAFPTRNLIEILAHFDSSGVRFDFTGQDGPCRITGDKDADYMVIVMPMQITEETYYTEENL